MNDTEAGFDDDPPAVTQFVRTYRWIAFRPPSSAPGRPPTVAVQVPAVATLKALPSPTEWK